ncbi:MAG: hypothetical protein GXO48_01025 [Chlorobi bacterium]|nr:hypothetical protein [Chlorobiota bacterium]
MEALASGIIASSVLSFIVDEKTSVDPYMIGATGGILFLGGLLLPGAMPIAGIGTGLVTYGALNLGGSARIYRNNYSGLVYVLAERVTGKAYTLSPHSTKTPDGIDGLAVPAYRKDAVFKVPNGIKTIITEQGCIEVIGYLSRLVTILDKGGWITEDEAKCRGWLNDGHWSKLFDKLKR